MPTPRPDRILNYSTEVKVEKTLDEIKAILRANGARRLTESYDGPRITGVEFALQTEYGEQWYRLPTRPERVVALLIAERNKGKRTWDRFYVDPAKPPQTILDQAERTAWRTVKDWLEVQFALVRAKQLEAGEVLFPYALTLVHGEEVTVYQAFTTERVKALGPG